MTLIKLRPTKDLKERRALLLQQNRAFLVSGDFTRYWRNCERIRKIAEELQRREAVKL